MCIMGSGYKSKAYPHTTFEKNKVLIFKSPVNPLLQTDPISMRVYFDVSPAEFNGTDSQVRRAVSP